MTISYKSGVYSHPLFISASERTPPEVLHAAALASLVNDNSNINIVANMSNKFLNNNE